MFPCPKGLELLRDYNFDMVINKTTGGANEVNTLPKSARRVGITVACSSGNVNIISPNGAIPLILLTTQPNLTTSKCTFWHTDLGPAIFDQILIQTGGAGVALRVWEINLPTDYKE